MATKQILSLGIGMACGLAHMHSKDVVHCDVKPGNIMLHDGVCLVSLGSGCRL
jgi:serine/threonine protein kinase